MGCDIHLHAEKRDADGLFHCVDVGDALSHQSYSVFAFLAGVRNYSKITPISAPRGIPMDASVKTKSDFAGWGGDAHTPSWLTLRELQAYDYNQSFEDRRMLGSTVSEGRGSQTTFTDFLGQWFFEDLQKLLESGAERIVFWFDC